MSNKKGAGVMAAFISLFICSELVNAQSMPEYWSGLQPGKFSVGFKSLCVFDTSRKYDLLKNKNLGRPVLINIWYPAKKSNDTTVLKVKDYFDFPSDENTQVFFLKLKEFQLDYSKLYSTDQNIRKKDFDGDSSLLENTRNQIFEHYLSAKTLSHRNAVASDGKYPFIIYHHGIGGTMDENNLLLEYLASNGYIVISSAFQDPDTTEMGTGDQRATFDDLNFIINYCRQNNISKSSKVFLMGHSYGANSSIGFLAEGHQNVNGIIPLDSDFGYNLYNFFPSKFNPSAKEQLKFYNVPVFCVGRSEAHYRMIDSFGLSERFYLTMSGMRHNDFTSQGAMGRYHCIAYVKDKDRYTQPPKNYLAMCTTILHFLNKYSTKGEKFTKKDVLLYPGFVFEAIGPGKKLPFNAPFNSSTTNCPTLSQLLDIIYNKGYNETEKVYTPCAYDTFSREDNFSAVLEAIYVDKGPESTTRFLSWMNNIKITDKNLRSIFSVVNYHSIWDRGNGFHLDNARMVYQWVIENFPNDVYGYMGLLLVSSYTSTGDIDFLCKKIVAIEPDYQKRKGKSFEENKIIGIIDKRLKSKSK
jgi:Chlorophyllase